MNQEIILTQQDSIATLRVNRPGARNALAASKQLVYAASQRSASETNRLEMDLFVDLWSQPDHLEALAAFRQKRRPSFGKRGSIDRATAKDSSLHAE